MNQPLDRNVGMQLIDAIHRLNQLSSSVIVNKNDDAEKAGLEKFLYTGLVAHASVLLGCWFTVKTEYEPLVNCFSHLLERANGLTELRGAQHRQLVAAAAASANATATADAPTPASKLTPSELSTLKGEAPTPAPENVIPLGDLVERGGASK